MDIGYIMSTVLRFHIGFIMTVYYKTQHILLQNATAVLLQNTTVITNCDNFITECDSYYKMRRLSQIATVHHVHVIYQKL